MRALVCVSKGRRVFSVALLSLVGALVFMVSGAFADAGNPILGTIKASAVDNGNGTITIYVRGQWNWLTHKSDCNFDRAGAGVGIIWNDTTERGYTVMKGAISAEVGSWLGISLSAACRAESNAKPPFSWHWRHGPAYGSLGLSQYTDQRQILSRRHDVHRAGPDETLWAGLNHRP